MNEKAADVFLQPIINQWRSRGKNVMISFTFFQIFHALEKCFPWRAVLVCSGLFLFKSQYLLFSKMNITTFCSYYTSSWIPAQAGIVMAGNQGEAQTRAIPGSLLPPPLIITLISLSLSLSLSPSASLSFSLSLTHFSLCFSLPLSLSPFSYLLSLTLPLCHSAFWCLHLSKISCFRVQVILLNVYMLFKPSCFPVSDPFFPDFFYQKTLLGQSPFKGIMRLEKRVDSFYLYRFIITWNN